MPRNPANAAAVTQLPSVRQLRYFVALEQSGHFGRAAAACHVSQPAFSVAIRELESRLAIRLVDRSNRRVTITPAGREIAAQARLCLRDLEQLAELATRRQAPLSGPVTLGVIPTIAPFLLPKCLPEIRRRYPDIKLFIREEQSAPLLDQLDRGEIDIVLLALPFPLRNVSTMTLFRDEFVLACRKDTHLADPQHFSLNRITAESMLLLEEGHCLREQALAACQVRSLDPINRFAASSLFTLVEMVDSDLGITILPAMAIGSALLKGTQVRTWPLPKGGYRDITLVWRKTSDRDDEFRKLGELIRAVATASASTP